MYITREELIQAYFDCRKSKRYTYQAFKFELDYPTLLENLYQELKTDQYHPSPEIVFIIEDPKVREIFAAIFKDRIVHHIFINRIKNYMEEYYSDSSYNCRPNRGNINACKKLQRFMKENPDAWCLGLDIESFFMSIDRKQTLSDLIKFIKLNIEDAELQKSTIQLANIILTNDVTLNCKKACSINKWDKLSKNKSLFGISTGFPIGDITSQFNANFILTYIDDLINNHNFKYVRYADDLRIIGSKKDLIELKNLLFKLFPTSLHLNLNRNKITLQPVKKGSSFVGYFVKANYLLPGKRLKKNSLRCIEHYLGFFSHCRAYKFLNKQKT